MDENLLTKREAKQHAERVLRDVMPQKRYGVVGQGVNGAWTPATVVPFYPGLFVRLLCRVLGHYPNGPSLAERHPESPAAQMEPEPYVLTCGRCLRPISFAKKYPNGWWLAVPASKWER